MRKPPSNRDHSIPPATTRDQTTTCILRSDTVRCELKTNPEPHRFKDRLRRGKYSKLRQKILVGSSDTNSDFAALCQLISVATMSIKYELIINWSDQDQSFVVEVPELPGCLADGETYEDAVMNAQLGIEERVETARELGRSIPEPKGRLMYS